MAETLDSLLAEIRACAVCALPHGCRPVVRVGPRARVLIAGQAPGARVHASGLPFDDASGRRLRDWLGVDAATFYDEALFAFAPMGFCYPGADPRGGDLPPRAECAPLWRSRLMAAAPAPAITVLVGGYAQAWHLGAAARGGLTRTVARWRDFAPTVFPLPHPSWRNTAWIKRHPWFEAELLPVLRAAVALARDASRPS